jgi:hypothetical protein
MKVKAEYACIPAREILQLHCIYYSFSLCCSIIYLNLSCSVLLNALYIVQAKNIIDYVNR